MPEVYLTYGQRQFTVDVEFNGRKYLCVSVQPDLRIVAKAPLGYQPELLHRLLKRRAGWIARQFDFFEQFHPMPPPREFTTGETHAYLGRQYRLRIRPGAVPRVRLVGRFFEMELPDPKNNEKAKTLMLHWYSSHTRERLNQRLALHLPTFLRMCIQKPDVRFRRMKRRWGSCSEKGVITLNTELVKAPIHCIDYVIIHELCHLLCPYHDRKFYRLLGRVLPDWKKRKDRLEKVII